MRIIDGNLCDIRQNDIETLNNDPYLWKKVISIGPVEIFDDELNKVIIPTFSAKTRNFLTEIVLPGSVKVVRKEAFKSCINLQSIIWKDSKCEHVLDAFAFENCRSLEKVKLPNNIKMIFGGTFANCEKLIEINLQNVEKIYYEAFTGCTNLKKVELNKNVKLKYESFDNGIKIKYTSKQKQGEGYEKN